MRQRIARILAAGLLVLGPGCSVGVPVEDEDAAKKDLQSLQGTWAITGREVNGKKATKEEIALLTSEVVIKDGKCTLWKDDKGAGKKEIAWEATLKLDPTTKPKALDLTYTSGESKGKTEKAIYEVTGDTIKVCFSFEGGDRPTEFAGKADGKAFLLTYKRVKK
jgi:uncharacterized protein (TIGR03067 family)